MRAPVIPEGELLAREERWRFAAHAGGTVLAGECDAPEELVAACGERPVLAHDAKAPAAACRRCSPTTRWSPRTCSTRPGGRYPLSELVEERGLGCELEEPLAADGVVIDALSAAQREQIGELRARAPAARGRAAAGAGSAGDGAGRA